MTGSQNARLGEWIQSSINNPTDSVEERKGLAHRKNEQRNLPAQWLKGAKQKAQPDKPFFHDWQDYRWKDRLLKPISDAGYTYPKPGKYTACVKVADTFGCDTP